jgi:hypothetical protein
MKVRTLFFFCFLSSNVLFAQETIQDSVKQKRFGLVLLPTRSQSSSGITIGPIGSEVICGYHYYKNSNGLNIQMIGQGAFNMF